MVDHSSVDRVTFSENTVKFLHGGFRFKEPGLLRIMWCVEYTHAELASNGFTPKLWKLANTARSILAGCEFVDHATEFVAKPAAVDCEDKVPFTLASTKFLTAFVAQLSVTRQTKPHLKKVCSGWLTTLCGLASKTIGKLGYSIDVGTFDGCRIFLSPQGFVQGYRRKGTVSNTMFLNLVCSL
jgi:hypothetical protein